jgi:O-acetyl-ADP-ribose deacetylase (regulator of RNase III)
MKVLVKVGDITKENVDAIVNSAHEHLLGGGGVDGAIHRAAGRGLLQECKGIFQKKTKFGDYIRCDTGEVHITKGYNLPAKYVIHTVGPRCVNGIAREIEEEKLMDCWLNSLNLAKENNLTSISFPSISTGAFMFPIRKAANIAMNAIEKHLNSGTTLENVNIVCFSEIDKNVYKAALENLVHENN